MCTIVDFATLKIFAISLIYFGLFFSLMMASFTSVDISLEFILIAASEKK